MAAAPDLWVVHLPRLPYREGLALQERVREAREAGRIPDTLLVLEHDPVYTRGRRSDPAELPLGEAWYAERGIEIVDVDRGGKVTYHGPGQVVAYPIVAVTDVVAHVRALAAALDARATELEAGPWPPELGTYVREHVARLRAELALIRATSTEENAALLEALGAGAAALPLEALRGLLRAN